MPEGDAAKYATTFGFSHGIVSGNAEGGIQLRKGVGPRPTRHDTEKQKELQICFSMASKASSLKMMQSPDASATVLENVDENIGTMNKTPTGLGSRVRIMEELGKRETPLSLSGNDSVTLLPAG